MSTNRIQKSFIELRFKRHIIIPKQNSEIRFNEPVFKSIFTTKKKTKKTKNYYISGNTANGVTDNFTLPR